ncbi:MAG: PA2779 family protein [Chromatiales bacterium]
MRTQSPERIISDKIAGRRAGLAGIEKGEVLLANMLTCAKPRSRWIRPKDEEMLETCKSGILRHRQSGKRGYDYSRFLAEYRLILSIPNMQTCSNPDMGQLTILPRELVITVKPCKDIMKKAFLVFARLNQIPSFHSVKIKTETIVMIKRMTSYLMITMLLFTGVPLQAYAGVIGTDQAIAAGEHTQRIERLQEMLSRDDVKQELVLRGVDPLYASERVAALTQEELASLAGQIDSLPAGADAIAVLGVVFLVLLVLEVTGVINIFK